jgi:signal recognition particle subunit SRP54
MAIIDSMTPGERKHPDLLKASRKKRIAAGSGTKVEEVNKLLKMHRTMADMMKVMGGGRAKGPIAGLAQMMGLGGGMPSPEEMAKLAEKMPGGLPGAPGLPPAGPGGPGVPGLPGLGKFPGLGGPAPKLPTPGGLPPEFFKKK